MGFLATVPVWLVPVRPVCVLRWSEGSDRTRSQVQPEVEQSVAQSLLDWGTRRTRSGDRASGGGRGKNKGENKKGRV